MLEVKLFTVYRSRPSYIMSGEFSFSFMQLHSGHGPNHVEGHGHPSSLRIRDLYLRSIWP